jgi:hypothetical protein
MRAEVMRVDFNRGLAKPALVKLAAPVDRLAIVLWAAVPGAPLAAGLAARALLDGAPAGIAVDLAQPLVVVTAWGPFGAGLFALWAAGITAGALALTLLCVRAARGGGDLPAGSGGRNALVVCAALALAAGLAWPCVFSSDVYAYAAYGDQALHGQNPYRPASAAAHDAYLDAARWQWTRTSFPACVYGPLFVAAGAAAVAVTDQRIVPTLWLLRLAASAAFLAAILVLDAALAGTPRRRIHVALFALNPVALWSAAEGHNDGFVILAVLGAVLAARRGQVRLAGALVALTPLVKAIGLIAAPPFWALLGRRARGRFGWTFLLVALAVAAVVVPLQLTALGGLARHGRYAPQFSLQGLIGPLPALLIAGALGIAALIDLRRGRPAGAVRLALALWLAIPNPYPWYALWIAPLAAAAPWSWESAALLGATFSIGLRYLPDAYGDMAGTPGALLTLGELLPAGLALLAFRPRATTSGRSDLDGESRRTQP